MLWLILRIIAHRLGVKANSVSTKGYYSLYALIFKPSTRPRSAGEPARSVHNTMLTQCFWDSHAFNSCPKYREWPTITSTCISENACNARVAPRRETVPVRCFGLTIHSKPSTGRPYKTQTPHLAGGRAGGFGLPLKAHPHRCPFCLRDFSLQHTCG